LFFGIGEEMNSIGSPEYLYKCNECNRICVNMIVISHRLNPEFNDIWMCQDCYQKALEKRGILQERDKENICVLRYDTTYIPLER